jgi:nitrile hydratase subunit beta
MTTSTAGGLRPCVHIVKALGEEPAFAAGDRVRVSARYPIGHYRVPMYMRGKRGVVERVLEPAAVDNEEEGFGRNAGSRRHYYRVSVPLTELWPGSAGSAQDRLVIEIFETWLERD